MQRPDRNPLHRRTIDPLQRDFLETHYGSLIWSPYSRPVYLYSLQKPYTSITKKPVRNPLQIPHMGPLSKVLQIPYRNFVDPLYRDLIETHEGSFILFLIENPDLRGCRPPNQVTYLYRCSMYYKITKPKFRNVWKFYP